MVSDSLRQPGSGAAKRPGTATERRDRSDFRGAGTEPTGRSRYTRTTRQRPNACRTSSRSN